jgi:peroxiredoxin
MTIFLLLLILISLCIGFYELVKQQGRILLRLDKLEELYKITVARNEVHSKPNEPQGLALGTAFPRFNYPDLMGQSVGLDSFQGKNVLLVHWSFGCGFCDYIAPDLARLEASFNKQNIQLVLLAYGDAQSNREHAAEHGLECPILLLRDETIPALFERLGTPAAYLLDAEGRVAAPLAAGADRVLSLAQEAAANGIHNLKLDQRGVERKRLPGERSLADSQIERNGVKAGTPAPLFRLPDLHGRIVALETYRGRRVLLIFSDPHCGPCDQLAPHLARLHREHANNGMDLVLIARGDHDENRRKAQQHGLQFPVVLQEKWKLSKEYGIFATPVAFLIDEGGLIAKDVAIGADAILALARTGLGQTEAEDEIAIR